MTSPRGTASGLPLWIWGGLFVATGLVFGLALLPPALPPAPRALLMEGFSSMCHQMPARSPHLYGVQLAVCDRCIGIYGGLILGTAMAGHVRLWQGLSARPQLTVLGALVPMGIDWMGSFLGLWTSAPLNRAVTGGLFGAIVATYTAGALLWTHRTQVSGNSNP